MLQICAVCTIQFVYTDPVQRLFAGEHGVPNEERPLLRPPISQSPITSPTASAARPQTLTRLAIATTLGALVASGLSIAPLPAASVPASAATHYLADSMSRTSTTGWGSPETGKAYSFNAKDRFSISSGVGAIKLLPGKHSFATSAINQANAKAKVDVSFDSLPQAGSMYAHLALRHSSDSRYESSLRLTDGGKLILEVSKTVNGKKSVLDSHVIDDKASVGKAYRMEFAVTGTASPKLQARAYAGSSAPAWQVSTEDQSASAITSAGSLRTGGYLSSQAAKASGLRMDNLLASSAAAVISELPEDFVPRDITPTLAPTDNHEAEESVPEATPDLSPDSTLPSNALYVSTSGSNSAKGTFNAPVRSIGTAISKASSGQTIVVRAGSYHETVKIPSGKKIHLRSYPGEKVWLDGSSLLKNFSTSNGRYTTAWNHDFDSSPTYTRGAKDNTEEAWGFVNDDYPMAAHPEQVWIDGVAQKQVGSLSAVRAGTFYVDKAGNKMTLGTNPSGKSVRASTLVKALSIRADGSTVNGINVRKYAPSVPDMGAVTAEKPGISLSNLTVEDSATTGINVSAVNNKISNVRIQRSGMLGMNAVYADGLSVNKLVSTANNAERFNSSPVSGGLKITRSRGITVKNSTLSSNKGPGLWIDESVYNSKVLNNDMANNTGHGMSLEISAKAIVANNRIINNGGNGFKLNNSNDVQIWNNTISGKNRALNIVQDKRRGANKSDPGHDPRQSFPDATMPWIIKNITVKNNVLSNSGGGNAIMAVEDFSKEFTAEQMKISLASNAYHRTSTTSPKWSAVWANAAKNPHVYTTLAGFQKAKGQDKSSFEVTAGSVLTSGNELAASVTSKAGNATALPSSIASLISETAGSKRVGHYSR